MTETSQKKNRQINAESKQELLRTIQFEQGFHFYAKLGDYSGITATSLDEFARKLQVAPAESVLFHFQRNDFQNWIKNVVGDAVLAVRLDRQKRRISSKSTNENLRKELLGQVQKRLTELRRS